MLARSRTRKRSRTGLQNDFMAKGGDGMSKDSCAPDGNIMILACSEGSKEGFHLTAAMHRFKEDSRIERAN